jgi:hypothetical protein
MLKPAKDATCWSWPQFGPRPTPRNFSPPQSQSLAKQNRRVMQMIENNQQRPKSIASFCRVFLRFQRQRRTAKAGRFANRPYRIYGNGKGAQLPFEPSAARR